MAVTVVLMVEVGVQEMLRLALVIEALFALFGPETLVNSHQHV